MKTSVFEKTQLLKSNTITIGGAGVSMPSVAIQKKEAPEEDILQGKFTVQKKEPADEEEFLQRKPFQLKNSPTQFFAEEEVPLQRKFVIQRQTPPEEEQPLQKKPFQLFTSEKEPVQKKVNNTGLPDNLKSGIENLSGYAMNDVKVHYNSSKPAQLQAYAYAQGTDIHIGPGQEKHLPHEAWHVVQQKQGRVQPTMQMKGRVAINDDPGLEHEADMMGGKALQIKQEQNISFNQPFKESLNKTIQPKWLTTEKGNILKWDAPMGKLQWYYNSETDKQYYIDENGKSEEHKYIDWLKSGMQGLKDKDLEADKKKSTPGINAREETNDEYLLKLENEGKALFQNINPGGIKISKDNIWLEQYAKTTKIDGENEEYVSISTGWNSIYLDRMLNHNAIGRYQNNFNLITGEITAVDNHRDPMEPLNNNEVIYQQLKMACEKLGQKLTISSLLRKNVINSTLEPLLRENKGKKTCTPHDSLFYILLATPNIKVAVHMINDRGALLNISTISKMEVEGKNVTIFFK